VRSTVRSFVGFLLVLGSLSLLVAVAAHVDARAGTPATLSGVVVAEHGDDFVSGTEHVYLSLVTSKDRYSLSGPGLAAVHAGMHVSVAGRLTGGTIYVASAASVQPLSTDKLAASDSAMVSDAASTTAPAQTKNVAVLLINFAAPTPSPTISPTPCVPPTPTPTPTGTPTATPDPNGTPTPPPTATPAPGPTQTPFACPSPTPSPTPTPAPPQPWTTTQVAGYYFNNNKSVASFYREVSNGSMTVTGTVYGWFTLTMATNTCDYNGFATAARAAATAAGVDLTTYTNIAYAFPSVAACSWGGMGVVNGPYSWINGSAAMGVYVPTHELGHNFGSHHASSLTCVNGSGTRVQYSNNCTASEYGDPFDVMGSNASSSGGIHHQNTWAMRQIGVLTTADQQTVTASGTYFVATAPVTGGVPRILRVLRPSGDYYYLEFRQPYGTLYENWDPTSPTVNGVMIRIAPDKTRIQSKLIDCHPGTATFSDAPCLVGDKFVDSVNKITIITRSVGPAGASVYVLVGPDVTAPTAPASLAGTWTGASSVNLSWTAASDEIGVTGYEVRRDGTLLATVPATTLTYSDSAAPATTQSYSVAARDAAGNLGPATFVSVGLADETAPGAPGSLEAVPAGPGAADLAWSAATDNVAVAGYDVSVDGTVVATVDSLSYQATGLASAQTYAFAVAARDEAGNVGQAVDAGLVMPDLVAPGSPSDLAVSSFGKTSVSLAWSAATDDVGVVAYDISRDSIPLGTTTSVSFDDTSLVPETTYTYSVAALDAAGNLGPSLSVVATTAEATPPFVAAPVITLASGAQVGTSTVPIVVSWSAADPSGVASVELQQSKNGGAWSAVTLPAPTATSVSLSRAAGSTYAYRVRATDALANTSAWVAGSGGKLLARQESYAGIVYGGSWTTATVASAYGGSLRYASTSKAIATLTFTGSSVAWVAPRSATRGKADVYVDGVLATTVDLYAATAQARMIVFSQSGATATSHTLQIRVKATSGRPRVDLDAFVVVR